MGSCVKYAAATNTRVLPILGCWGALVVDVVDIKAYVEIWCGITDARICDI